MERQTVSSGSPYEPVVGYSRAVRVGDRVFVAGSAPIMADGSDPPVDAYSQAKRCLEIVGDALRQAGASLEDVVRTRVYLTDAGAFDVSGAQLAADPSLDRAARDAEYSVDGGTTWKPSSSNVISDAVIGVKITVKGITEGAQAINVGIAGVKTGEVKDKLKQSAFGLSGGQQQRLCIARTIAVRPEVILMDEPCSALDPIATAKVEELIRQLKQQYTIVIVTHNMQQAGRCSDHTAFFYLGRLIEFDHTAKIFSNPGQRQTEEYITGRFG